MLCIDFGLRIKYITKSTEHFQLWDKNKKYAVYKNA